MQGQVFWSLSESDNGVFASTVAHSGLPLWSWIISDADSQSEWNQGQFACSLASLQFAKLVLLKIGHDPRSEAAGTFLAEIRREFFNEVLNICEQGPDTLLSVEEAYLAPQYHPRFRDLTPLLHGAPNDTVHRTLQVPELIIGLEETQLPSALTLTTGGHIRVCVYAPFHPVPLFLVFDSAARFGRGASVVVHTSRPAATAHLAAMCTPNDTEPADSPLRALSGDFFVLRATADAEAHKVRTAAMALDLRFGVERVARDVARAARRAGTATSAPDAIRTPTTLPAVRATAQHQRRGADDTPRGAARSVHFVSSLPPATSAHLAGHSPSSSAHSTLNTPARSTPPLPSAAPAPVYASWPAYPTPPDCASPLPSLHAMHHAAYLRLQAEQQERRAQGDTLGSRGVAGGLDLWADAGLQRPRSDATRHYAGVV
ncbi:hypothetical protein DFH07DRAFT_967126 [Mycena maculata]|uniref:Uncharacterized protein n=1 Tax=Mycena maculata TaxID=230809 RepID=A0AAD7I799_9AGAR|nr:hypothetical protein DFH07DRAFT_967126 [Mycena maculata]